MTSMFDILASAECEHCERGLEYDSKRHVYTDKDGNTTCHMNHFYPHQHVAAEVDDSHVGEEGY
jgi:hypothetical protein